MTQKKDINYWKNNCEEDYMTTPISVLRYISELEKLVTYPKQEISDEEIEKGAKEIHIKEMCEFAEFVATYPDKNKNVNGDMLHAKSKYDGAERTIDLLNIFKKNKNKG